MAGSEGPSHEPFRVDPVLMESPGMYNLDVFDGLDFALYEIGKRGMTATVCLSNYWHWSGGFSAYVSWTTKRPIPYPSSWNYTSWTNAPEQPFLEYTDNFYHLPEAQKLYSRHLETVIERVNRYSDVQYKDDPSILAWELANEPQRPSASWIRYSTSLIKSLDPNHLVTAGMESRVNLEEFLKVHSDEGIDFCTIHVWAQNRGEYNMTDPSEENIAHAIAWGLDWLEKVEGWAGLVKKPLLLEEFGFPRDNWVDSYNPYSAENPTTRRDRYFRAMIERVRRSHQNTGMYVGFGFWTYSGEARNGDTLGDPPHEPGGWYSIYDKDESTLQIIANPNI
jgi:mannan endo-1,4-beta-mannosidase